MGTTRWTDCMFMPPRTTPSSSYFQDSSGTRCRIVYFCFTILTKSNSPANWFYDTVSIPYPKPKHHSAATLALSLLLQSTNLTAACPTPLHDLHHQVIWMQLLLAISRPPCQRPTAHHWCLLLVNRPASTDPRH